MYILGIRIHASNDALVKIWAVALALILAVAAFLTWSNRFRETVETSIARISPFGAEVAGKENANFTGKRGFFSKRLDFSGTRNYFNKHDMPGWRNGRRS